MKSSPRPIVQRNGHCWKLPSTAYALPRWPLWRRVYQGVRAQCNEVDVAAATHLSNVRRWRWMRCIRSTLGHDRTARRAAAASRGLELLLKSVSIMDIEARLAELERNASLLAERRR